MDDNHKLEKQKEANIKAAVDKDMNTDVQKRRGSWIFQFITFGLVGAINTALDFVVYMVLVSISVHFAAAQSISYSAGMVCSYILNNKFTFGSSAGADRQIGADPRLQAAVRKKQLRFVIWNLTMLALSIILLAFMTRTVGLDQLWAKAITTVLIVALNFYGSKRWVFA